jgi:hyperosmotically inducible protein
MSNRIIASTVAASVLAAAVAAWADAGKPLPPAGPSAAEPPAATARAPDEGRHGTDSGLEEATTDAMITARVKARLLWSSRTDGLDIGVTTTDRHVVLEGTVDTESEAEFARGIAWSTDGVSGVTSRLAVAESTVDRAERGAVRATEKAKAAAAGAAGTAGEKVQSAAAGAKAELDDAAISAWATAAVMGDSRFRDTRVDIRTEDGIVTLSGSVRDPGQRSDLIAVIAEVSGVRAVLARDLNVVN